MRNGQLFDNQPGKVKSFALPTVNTNASGAGGIGLGCMMAEGSSNRPGVIILPVEFQNGVKQVMVGRF